MGFDPEYLSAAVSAITLKPQAEERRIMLHVHITSSTATIDYSRILPHYACCQDVLIMPKIMPA